MCKSQRRISANLVDGKMRIFLQTLVSIRPRTSPPKKCKNLQNPNFQNGKPHCLVPRRFGAKGPPDVRLVDFGCADVVGVKARASAGLFLLTLLGSIRSTCNLTSPLVDCHFVPGFLVNYHTNKITCHRNGASAVVFICETAADAA